MTPSTLNVRLGGGPGAVSAARSSLDPLEPQLGAERFGDMRLLVSELVTNSVRHASSSDEDQVELAVTLTDECVHVCVTDGGPGFQAEPRSPEHDPAGGWGLFLVERLADRWGVELNGSTRVWFELER